MEQEFIEYKIEQELKDKIKKNRNDIEMWRYNSRFDSTGMLTIYEVFKRLQDKKALLLSYTAFYGYLIDFEILTKCRLFGEETYCVADKYSNLIKMKICKDRATKKYYFIYLLTDEGLKWLLSLMEEMDIVNWEAI